jgi:3-deoxy-manno-octulosonate cytidylyltransferase (CMP-KDO synthetase)
VEGARKAACLERLLVATDDQRILDTVQALGVQAVMTRPDHPSGTDRVAEAVGEIAADVVINIQGDEPLVDPGLIDRLAAVMLSDRGWDAATAATPIDRDEELNNPSVVKVVWDREGRALYFSRSAIPFVRDRESGGPPVEHWRHLGIYAYRREFLERLVATPPCALEKAERLEQLRALHIGGRMTVLTTEKKGIGVDTPEDVKYVEQVLRKSHGI